MKNIYTLFFFLLFNHLVLALPIFSTSTFTSLIYKEDNLLQPNSITSIIQQDDDTVSPVEKDIVLLTTNTLPMSSSCPQEDFSISVERFAQLISTHWQFDHLDTIKSNIYTAISKQFQKHIEISTVSENQNQNDMTYSSLDSTQQRTFKAPSNNWDMMDLELLHAQIFGAIQAHTEGSLHLAWDRLADKLGGPAFEHFIKQMTLSECQQEENMLSSTCLKEKANALSEKLDEYIHDHLRKVLVALDETVLPDLLSNTSKDLKVVLAYFNKLFLNRDEHYLVLKVQPYMSDDVKATLASLLTNAVAGSTVAFNDDHLTDFFSNYACLSRGT